MPILYSVVSRSAIVLAKYAGCAGNFAEVTEQILKQVPVNGGRLTYSHGRYLFHYIADEDGAVYLCITDDDFEQSKAFAFLGEIRRRFRLMYGERIKTALPYAMNSDFSMVLAGEMKAYNLEREPLKLTKAQNDVEDLKAVMVKNIDSLASRGEKLELLIDRTEHLEANSVSFRTTSSSLARHMFMKNMKMTILLVVALLLVVFIVVTASCGGLSYSKCS